MPVGAGSIKRAAKTADAAKNLAEEAAAEKNTKSKRTGKTKNAADEAKNKESKKNEQKEICGIGQELPIYLL